MKTTILFARSWRIGSLGRASILVVGLTAVLSASAQTITTYAGGAFPADNTTPFSISSPTAIARDAAGNLYVAGGDPTFTQVPVNNSTTLVRASRVFKVDTSGNVSLFAG